MSTIDDLRKLFQDFLAPELRAISQRIEDLEKLTDERFKHIDDRFKYLEEKIMANHREIMNALNLDKRLSILEDRKQREEHAQQ